MCCGGVSAHIERVEWPFSPNIPYSWDVCQWTTTRRSLLSAGGSGDLLSAVPKGTCPQGFTIRRKIAVNDNDRVVQRGILPSSLEVTRYVNSKRPTPLYFKNGGRCQFQLTLAKPYDGVLHSFWMKFSHVSGGDDFGWTVWLERDDVPQEVTFSIDGEKRDYVVSWSDTRADSVWRTFWGKMEPEDVTPRTLWILSDVGSVEMFLGNTSYSVTQRISPTKPLNKLCIRPAREGVTLDAFSIWAAAPPGAPSTTLPKTISTHPSLVYEFPNPSTTPPPQSSQPDVGEATPDPLATPTDVDAASSSDNGKSTQNNPTTTTQRPLRFKSPSRSDNDAKSGAQSSAASFLVSLTLVAGAAAVAR